MSALTTVPDTSVGAVPTAEHLEVITPATSPGVTIGTLVPSRNRGRMDELTGCAQQITDQLRLGTARVQSVRVGSNVIPTAIQVGGWPFAAPCCEDQNPSERERLEAGPPWECEACGQTAAPTWWAVVTLTGQWDGAWPVPDPSVVAAAADAALGDLTAGRHRDAAMRSHAVAEAFRRGQYRPGSAVVRLSGHSFADGNVAVFAPVAVLSREAGDSGDGVCSFGFWGTQLHNVDGRSGARFGWTPTDLVPASPAAATRLLVGHAALSSQAAGGRLRCGELQDAWRRRIGAEVPGWLCDERAVEDLADGRRQARRRARPSTALGL